ncbi:hypothetical protein [Xenorhabdus lircayensis]|nr:hypothetical protein [Xenorhabdus lircayensis]
MKKQYDFETIFKLLNEMEACVSRVKELHTKLDADLFQVKKAA